MMPKVYYEPSPQRGPQAHSRWNRADLGRLIYLREEEKLDWNQISRALGRTVGQCHARYNYGRHSTIRAAGDASPNHKCSQEQLAERDLRAEAYSQRDYTASFFGDPPVGFRALDRRGKTTRRTPSIPNISAMSPRGCRGKDAR